MKKKLFIALIAVVTIITVAVPVFAKQGSFSDTNVDYNYWDQEGEQTYWTGVYNKIDYNYYGPCVGPKRYTSAEYYCGPLAPKGTYHEKSGKLYNGHSHSLLSDYGTYDYWVE